VTDQEKGDNASDPLLRALRDLAGDPQPTAADRQRGEEALLQAIARERVNPKRRWSLRKSWSLSVVVAAALVVVLGLTFLLPTPTAASAALSEIAAAAERVDPLVIPPQAFAYTRSKTTVLVVQPSDAFGDLTVPVEGIAYLLPQTREVWIGIGGVVQMRITTGPPSFFTPEAEAAYYSSGLDQIDQVGETVTGAVRGALSLFESRVWPTNPDQLKSALRSLVPPDRGLGETVEILDLALDLLRETGATPELRAAVIHVLADLDLQLLERRPDGSITLASTYESPLLTRDTFTLNPNGTLLEESSALLEGNPNLSIPSGTLVFHANYKATSFVENLSQPHQPASP